MQLAAPASRVVCWVEGEAYAASVLANRMEEGLLDSAPIWSDLRTFDGRPWRGVVDCVTAGYPCQPFSLAGRRRGADDPRHLWPHVLRVLVECRAPLLFCENVRGHVSKGLGQVLGQLACFGFSAEWDLFSAEEEGAPHRRERIFLLAHTGGPELREQQGGSSRSSGKGPSQSGLHGEDGSLANASCYRRAGGLPSSGSAGWAQSPRGLAALPNPDRLREPQPEGCEQEERGRDRDSPRWPPEPGVARVVVHGLAAGVDRSRAIGNGVVAPVAARAWRELTRRAGLA